MYKDEEEIDIITPTRVQVLPQNLSSTPIPQSSLAFPLQLDPISTILLFPFIPFIQLINIQMQMMTQLSNQTQNQRTTKITSITRNGNTLDIVEKWI